MSDASNGLGPNSVLAGKYRLEGLLGRGGMGSVWRAEHLGLSAPVAVKLLDLIDLGGEALARFHREARAAATIRSPHVVQILDHGVDPTLGVPFIVMELMEGESLAQRLARVGRLEPATAAQVFTQIARALSRAHDAQIVHRDLKPDNVFLVRNEDEEVAKVLDFGIAKTTQFGVESSTRTGAVMGTAYYMSPEQISGEKNVDFRSDLWALGVMACECLTGKRPFEAETIGGLALRICVEPLPVPSSFGQVPDGFDAWFARSVSRDPPQRFASAREAADGLRRVCGGEPLPALLAVPRPESLPLLSRTITSSPLSRTTPAPPKPAGRLKLVLGVVAALAVAAAFMVFRPTSGTATTSASSATAAALPATTPAVTDITLTTPTERPSAAVAPPANAAPSASPSAAAETPAAANTAAGRPFKPHQKPQLAAEKPALPAAEKPAAKEPSPPAAAATPTPHHAQVGDLIDDRH